MKRSAKDGKLLDKIVMLALESCRSCDAFPGRPGRPPLVPYWALAVMVTVCIALGKKSKSAQSAWWCAHRSEFNRWFPNTRFPGRSTFFERYAKVSQLLQDY